MESQLFEEVGDALRGMLPPDLGELRLRVRRYGIKVWFGPADPPREHYEAQVIGADAVKEAKVLALEIGFHAEHSQVGDNTKIIEHLLACEAEWRPGVGDAAVVGPFLGRATSWRRVSETWADPDLGDPELAIELAALLADYITALEPGARVVKIVSLLPSATEIVFALGLGGQLEGVTHECDFPGAARSKRIVSGTTLPDRPMTAGEIDDIVTSSVHSGEPIYALDAAAIRDIGPDLILTQDLCEVCAVPSGAVDDALATLGCTAEVISLDPSSVDDVIAGLGVVGAVTDTTARAEELMGRLRARVQRVRAAVAGRPRPRTLALEWSDPPFSGGHWVPEMIDAAGGEPVLGTAGERSRRLSWSEIRAAAAEVVMFMPCGYGLDDAAVEGVQLLDRTELLDTSHIYALPADALFSRPGPRVVDGIELLATLLHPDSLVSERSSAPGAEPRSGDREVRAVRLR